MLVYFISFQITYSLPAQVTVAMTFCRLFNNKKIIQNDSQWKTNFKYLFFHKLPLYNRRIHSNEKYIYLTGIYKVKIWHLLPSGFLAQLFKFINRILFMPFAVQNIPVDLIFSGFVLKSDVVEEALQNRKSGHFFIFVN